MKKVIQFIPALYDGGAETLVKDYAILANKSLIETVIVTVYPFKDTANFRRLKAANVNIISIFQNWDIKSKLINKIIPKVYKTWRIRRIIQTEKPDVIHVHMWLLEYLEGLENELQNVKVFYTCHSLPEYYFTGERAREYNAAQWLFRNTSFQMIALHDNMRIELNRMFNVNNTVVIRNGINFSKFRNVKITKEKKREELNIPKDSYLIGHIGRYVKSKNQEFIIDIFSELIKIKPNAHLLLVGNGDNENDIKNKIISLGIENCVTMLSHRDDIPELLHCMDVFLFPSLYEGLGIALIEAQVCELPCVVSDRIPSEAYITSHITELSLKSSAKEWAKAVIKPQCNIKSWKNMEEYDMNFVMKKIETLYLN